MSRLFPRCLEINIEKICVCSSGRFSFTTELAANYLSIINCPESLRHPAICESVSLGLWIFITLSRFYVGAGD